MGKKQIRCDDSLRPHGFAAPRRLFLAAVGGATIWFGLRRSADAHEGGQALEPIPQPAGKSDAVFIERAFEMRQRALEEGDQAYGAVIVQSGVIVGQSLSRVILDNDPTAHAELSSIRDAARRIRSRDLSGAIMYSSSRPCPMCEAAAYWAGISQMIYGRDARSAGAPHLCR